MSFCLSIFCVLTILTLGYYYVKRKFSYWSDRGVPCVESKFPVGSMAGVGSKITFGEMAQNAYNELKGKGPVGGLYFFTEPAVIITDMDLLRDIFVKDFQYFDDRGMYVNERDDPLTAHLFSLEGGPWKILRTKLSPTFTSGKMKMMHSTILTVADQFTSHLESISGEDAQEVDFRETLAQFTTDIIGNVAFGVECNSLKDPDSEFRRIGKKIVESSTATMIISMFTILFPKLSRFLRIKITPPEVTKFFFKMLGDTIKYREENNVQRNDFLSLLIQIMKTGKLEGDSTDLGKMTFSEVAAQVFLFFVAGFETSSSTMSFAFYELALNPEIQERARKEVRQAMENHGGELTYEAAMELRYIDQIIQETLRKYPVVETHFRKTTKTYKVPNTNIVLEKGTSVFIPALGFHRDPAIYPDPEKFDPERFTKENIATRHPYAWTPFGKGPRDCVGMRFAMMQTRLGIATVLKGFRVSPSERTLIPMKFQPDGQLLCPAGGKMYLNLESVDQ